MGYKKLVILVPGRLTCPRSWHPMLVLVKGIPAKRVFGSLFQFAYHKRDRDQCSVRPTIPRKQGPESGWIELHSCMIIANLMLLQSSRSNMCLVPQKRGVDPSPDNRIMHDPGLFPPVRS